MNIQLKKYARLLILPFIVCLAAGNTAVAANDNPVNAHPPAKSHQKGKTIPNLLKYVNTLQGTASQFHFSHGNDYPIIGLPHGVNYWSPQTGKNGDGWKYQYQAKTIRGFDEAHQQYVWGGSAPNVFSLMPVSGKLVVGQKKRAATFSHSNEIAKPNYYKVTFKNGTVTQIAPTERCAFFQFSFPKSKKAYLVLDGYIGRSEVHIYPKKQEITGFVQSKGQKDFKNYFIIHFNQPIVSYGTWENVKNTIAKNERQGKGKGAGAFVQFKKGAQVNAKVSSSPISLKQAALNLKRELGNYHNVMQVKNAAGKTWNKLLNQILVKGGTKAQKETFYSCLYRANLFPMKAYDLDKQGKPYFFDRNNGKVYHGYHYASFNFWDGFRSLFPLQTILNPTYESRYVKSLITFFQHNGWYPGGGMIGNHVISVLTDAWVKGIHSFNPDSALKYYYKTVTNPHSRVGYKDYFILGYVPFPQGTIKNYESTARTLAYAYDDYCAYKLAKMTHNTFYENIFKKYMYNYKNVFNPKTNFMEGRDASGQWNKNFNPYRWGGPFVEGDSWQWTWAVFHDIQGLMNLMGGAKSFSSKLDAFFKAPSDSCPKSGYGYRIHEMNEMIQEKLGQYAGGNEPSYHVGYLYDYCGQPWKTQSFLRKAMKRLFNAGPKGYPGDLDAGETAAWYVMSALGFYSVTPGTNQYVIGSPIFDKAVITMKTGKKFVINAKHNSSSNVYIQSATLNGKDYAHNWITQKDIVNGGVLNFKMGSQPNLKRGTKIADRPFSLSKPQK